MKNIDLTSVGFKIWHLNSSRARDSIFNVVSNSTVFLVYKPLSHLCDSILHPIGLSVQERLYHVKTNQ